LQGFADNSNQQKSRNLIPGIKFRLSAERLTVLCGAVVQVLDGHAEPRGGWAAQEQGRARAVREHDGGRFIGGSGQEDVVERHPLTSSHREEPYASRREHHSGSGVIAPLRTGGVLRFLPPTGVETTVAHPPPAEGRVVLEIATRRGRVVDPCPVEAGGGARHVREGDLTDRKGKTVRLDWHKTAPALEVNREGGRCLYGIGTGGVLSPVASARPHRRSFLIKLTGRGLYGASHTGPEPVMR
jgi:hypothetical protein